MNHSKSPKNPHREEKEVSIEFTEASFTYNICESLIVDLNKKKPFVPASSESIKILKKLNETAAFIGLIRKRAKQNNINTKEGYSEAERKLIHKKISNQARALFNSLATLDRDVFHDWCIEDLFTADNKYNFISAERLPDYEAERQFYETVGALAKTANHCAHKSKIELSGVSGNLATRPGIDIALNAIIASYTELTNEAPTKGGPLNLTKYEAFSIECLAIMGFKGVSDDALRHMTKKATADFSKN